MSWCTIESDPGVFTELISEIGVQGVQVEELYDLEVSNLKKLAPVYGLIFLFKWQSDEADDRVQLEESEDIYFARQMINNACATQAILNILLNCQDITLGDTLRQFKEFTMALPPDMRGEAIGTDDRLRTVHNSFSRPEPFIFEDKDKDKGEAEDAFHFIGFVPVNGILYELDGLKQGPIVIGGFDGDDGWLQLAASAIQDRITKYAAKEIRFNLLALVRNRKETYTQKLAQLTRLQQRIQNKINGTADESMDTETVELPSDPAALSAQLLSVQDEMKEAQHVIDDEQLKAERWKVENVRRKHNYVPFIFNLLKILAEKGKLNSLVESAAKATAERNARAAKNKKKDEK